MTQIHHSMFQNPVCSTTQTHKLCEPSIGRKKNGGDIFTEMSENHAFLNAAQRPNPKRSRCQHMKTIQIKQKGKGQNKFMF